MIGQSLAHYKILEKIGSGGMGEVYLAKDTKLDRKVALKVLPPELAESDERRARFKREAKAIAALNQPSRLDPAGSAVLWQVDLEDGEQTRLTSPVQGTNDWRAAWSHDGEWIAFQTGRRRGTLQPVLDTCRRWGAPGLARGRPR